jgi:superfamily II DNA or RNA helicase
MQSKLSGIDFKDEVHDLIACPEFQSDLILRDYQKQALDAWIANDKRGIVVLPTGAAKQSSE